MRASTIVRAAVSTARASRVVTTRSIINGRLPVVSRMTPAVSIR